MSNYYDDYDDDGHASCPICGADMEWEDCYVCYGEGGYHDCGEDCCPCLDKEETTYLCDERGGRGGYLQCISLPHTDAQMAEYRATKTEANQCDTTT